MGILLYLKKDRHRMRQKGILNDTHGCRDKRFAKYFRDCGVMELG